MQKRQETFRFFPEQKHKEMHIYKVIPDKEINLNVTIRRDSKEKVLTFLEKNRKTMDYYIQNSPFRIEYQNKLGERLFDIVLYNDGKLQLRKFTFKDGKEIDKKIIKELIFDIAQEVKKLDIRVTSEENIIYWTIENTTVEIEIPEGIELKDIYQVDILKIDAFAEITIFESDYINFPPPSSPGCTIS
jgi:hypothetical protein